MAYFGSQWMILHHGWPMVFHSFGLAGIGWCVAWQLACVLPSSQVKGKGPDMTPISEDLTLAWRLLVHRRCRPVYVAHFAHATASFIAFSWLPTYYADLAKHLGMPLEDPETMAKLSTARVMPYIVMCCMSFAGSVVADHLLRQGRSRTGAHGR